MKKRLLILSTSLLLITGCASNGTSTVSSPSNTTVTSQSSGDPHPTSSTSIEPPSRSCGFDGVVSGIHFVLPDLGEEVEIHTEMQKAYLETKYYGTVNRYADGLSEASYQEPVELSWSVDSQDVTKYTVNLSTDEDFSTFKQFETDDDSVLVDNLMIDTIYYWTVTVNDSITSGVAKFVTVDMPPRNLRIPGVKNVRDMGGAVGLDGKKIKQNRIIRCGALTLNDSGQQLIQQEGIDIFNLDFHIKTELDLRGETPTEAGNITNSILGKQVDYVLYGLKYSVSDLLINNKTQLNNIFTLLSKEESYPLCFHCSEGTDRAGMIAFVINALLGVNEEYCYRDYLFSAFRFCSGKIPALSNITNTYVKTIKSYAGSNLQEQTYNCLANLGVSKDTLNKFIALNLED